jgi:predicted DNA-binding antitoxin AbrB/MazE fold protein
MQKTIEAVYEDGVFKPKESISLPEHYTFKIIIQEMEDADKLLKESLQKGYHMGKTLNEISRENIYNDIG